MAVIPCGDRARNRTSKTGILQAGCIVAYIMYLTFSAINAQQMITVPPEQRPNFINDSAEGSTDQGCMERCFSLPDHFVGWLRGDGEVVEKIEKMIGKVTIDSFL